MSSEDFAPPSRRFNPDTLPRHGACVSCRERKIKCDGKPRCGPCVRSAIHRSLNPDTVSCVYTSPPPKQTAIRGASPSSAKAQQEEERIAALEARVAQLQANFYNFDQQLQAAFQSSPPSDHSSSASWNLNSSPSIGSDVSQILAMMDVEMQESLWRAVVTIHPELQLVSLEDMLREYPSLLGDFLGNLAN
ncbi:hypothetical protein BT69DRAFT_1294597 [Atractiella rhizophila]|nr:hypothetical protein BT69DRAFT_1294597 [Atractiella rhizophila]